MMTFKFHKCSGLIQPVSSEVMTLGGHCDLGANGVLLNLLTYSGLTPPGFRGLNTYPGSGKEQSQTAKVNLDRQLGQN